MRATIVATQHPLHYSKKKDFWSGTENGFVYDKSKYIADTEEEWNSMW